MNKHEITVISNSPANDIYEFVRTLGIFVESYRPNEIILKSGNILKFRSNPKLPGIRNYYYYKEVFESYLKQYIRHLENQNVEQDKEIERLNNIINEAREKSIKLQEKYGYILDDLTYLLMQNKNLQRRIGSEKNDKNSI